MPPDLVVPAGLAARSFRAMGTDVLVLAPARQARAAAGAVEELFAEWEQACSRFRPESELSRLNAAGGRPTAVGAVLLQAVGSALRAARETHGLFDPALGHELARIGYDRSFEEIRATHGASAGPRGGGAWREVVVDEAARTVELPRRCLLDLGGIAKGMAVDAALARLGALGVSCALVSAGGDLAVSGLPPGSASWPILVGDGADAPVVPLVRGALATSAVTRRAWLQGTTRRHHVVDPRTGEPSGSGLRQASVAAATCRDAEVAATAALVAGAALGSRLIQRRGLAGLLVTSSGRQVPCGRWPRTELRRAS